MPLLTPASVRAVLTEHDLRPSRALGQHFLADPNTARRIVRLAGVEAEDRVLEIGPGIGSLTLALAEAGARVVALEVDRHLLPVLESVVGDRATIVAGDATTIDLPTLLDDACRASEISRSGTHHQKGPTWQCVSNLPYNVATPGVAANRSPTSRWIITNRSSTIGAVSRRRTTTGGRDYGAV